MQTVRKTRTGGNTGLVNALPVLESMTMPDPIGGGVVVGTLTLTALAAYVPSPLASYAFKNLYTCNNLLARLTSELT